MKSTGHSTSSQGLLSPIEVSVKSEPPQTDPILLLGGSVLWSNHQSGFWDEGCGRISLFLPYDQDCCEKLKKIFQDELDRLALGTPMIS